MKNVFCGLAGFFICCLIACATNPRIEEKSGDSPAASSTVPVSTLPLPQSCLSSVKVGFVNAMPGSSFSLLTSEDEISWHNLSLKKDEVRFFDAKGDAQRGNKIFVHTGTPVTLLGGHFYRASVIKKKVAIEEQEFECRNGKPIPIKN